MIVMAGATRRSSQSVRIACRARAADHGHETRPTGGRFLNGHAAVSKPVFTAFRWGPKIERERGLMLAVLVDAINCYQKYAFSSNLPGRETFVDALEWLTSTDGSYLFSFESICEILEIDAEYVRRGLGEWYERVQGGREGRQTRASVGDRAPRRVRVCRVAGAAGARSAAHTGTRLLSCPA